MSIWQEINWFAIQTKHYREDLAAENIRRMSLDVLVPKIYREKKIRGKVRAVAEPLFYGYLFARFCPAVYLRLIRYARGVRRVVSAGDIPIPMDEEVIEAVQSRTMADGYVRMDEASYHPGQRVQIQEGPLKEIVGVFDRSLDGRERVVILLENINYQARVITETYKIKAYC
jgi:transcription elongation factor/antiterminator RfaH